MTIHSEPVELDHREPDEEMILDEGLDPRIIGLDSLASPAEELEAFLVNPSEPTQELKVGIDLVVACHALKVDPKVRPKIQKRRPLSAERYGALKEEVEKLLTNGFIREAVYPQWVSNPSASKKEQQEMEGIRALRIAFHYHASTNWLTRPPTTRC
ncbi:RT RNaseH 2 domain-containing protein [Abeliophyllum distichum]|uniref:RT RNaseH 2 domain-containing protein n=1 Tax=Abeliophyllum distichum TaxID=126358 RepID=A0ABD1TL16_9LAMI